MTKWPMVSRRPNSKDILSDRNSNIRCSSILEKFCWNFFSRITNLKNFAGINFRESKFSGIKKGIWFSDFGQISRNFLPLRCFHLLNFQKVHMGLPSPFRVSLIPNSLTATQKHFLQVEITLLFTILSL